MSKQVLALHRVSPRCYDLTGLRTGSVRDQLLRSTLIVNALALDGTIGAGAPLLIFGAGPAGINAAMQAAALHADVTVVELSGNVFSTLAACWVRRIDATEYDWPHPHWRSARFPMTGTIPLPMGPAMSGAALAAAFAKQWDNFLKLHNGKNGYGTVTLLQGIDAHSLAESDLPANALLEVAGRWQAGGAAPQTRQFGARLSCIGHGKELVSEMPPLGMWQRYAGPEFWTDSDGMFSYGPLPAGVANIVISGAGDGGMQDLQRAATSLFGRQLYDLLEQAASRSPVPLVDILPTDAMLRKLMSAEETARRAFGWASERGKAPHTLQTWHQAFAQPIQAMVSGWPIAVAQHLAQELFRTELLGPGPGLRIVWLMRDATPGYAYALNRFLSVLLCSLAERVIPGRIEVFVASELHAIAPVGHACTSAAACLGKAHRVTIDHGKGKQSTRDAELLIVRHGVAPGRRLKGAPVPAPEQMTPFDLPM